MILPYRTLISVSESKLLRIGSFLEHLKALGRSHLDFHLEKLIFTSVEGVESTRGNSVCVSVCLFVRNHYKYSII